MNREEFIKKLHPSITHINASDNMSEETLEAINIMVDKVSRMSTEEIEKLVSENKNQRDNCEHELWQPSKDSPMLMCKKCCKTQYEIMGKFVGDGRLL